MFRDDADAKPVDFSTAQQHPELRQEYLSGIDLGWARQYVSEILYSPTLEARAQCRPHSETKKGMKGNRSIICVGPLLFDSKPNKRCPIPVRSQTEALSIIRDHEGKHAEQHFTNPSVFCNIPKHPAAYLTAEWQAFREQMRKILANQNGISDEFREAVRKQMEDYREFSRTARKNRRKTNTRLIRSKSHLVV